MNRAFYIVVFVIVGFAWTGYSFADKIVLTNAEDLSGWVMGSASGYTVIKLDSGEQKRVPTKDIAKIVKTEQPPVPNQKSHELSEKEKKLEEALERKIQSAAFTDMPLEEVLSFLKLFPACKDVSFVLDKETLNDKKIIVTLQAKEVSLGKALTSMLKPKGLDFAIHNDAILISTRQRIAALKKEDPVGDAPKKSRELSDRERELDAMLDKRITAFSFDQTPLAEVLEFFKLLPDFKGANFTIEEDVGPEVFVTLTMQDTTLRQALTAMLKPNGRDFAIWNDAILISTPTRIEKLTKPEN